MQDAPRRIQLKRSKGWRMPPNTVKVDRSTRWGNPFRVQPAFGINEESVAYYRAWLTEYGSNLLLVRRKLRGNNLACWCRLCHQHANGKPLGVHCDNCSPCHSDVLLEIANAGAAGGGEK